MKSTILLDSLLGDILFESIGKFFLIIIVTARTALQVAFVKFKIKKLRDVII